MECVHSTFVFVIFAVVFSIFMYKVPHFTIKRNTMFQVPTEVEMLANKDFKAVNSFKMFTHGTLKLAEELPIFKQLLVSLHSKETKLVYKQFFKNAMPNLNFVDGCPKSGFISVGDKGGLGNHMGHYAGLYGMAREENLVPVITARMRDTLNTYFQRISLITYEDFDFSCNLTKRSLNIKKNPTNRAKIEGPANFHLISNPIKTRLIRRYRHEIIPQFTFRKSFLNEAKARIEKAVGKDNYDILIGVHVRRKDYFKHLLLKFGEQVVGSEYIRKAMNIYKEKFEKVGFLMVSNDMPWCNATFYGEKNVYMLGGGSGKYIGVDMAILSLCNHTILTHGSYGFWGAYFANGSVIFPRSNSRVGVELREAKLQGWTMIDP